MTATSDVPLVRDVTASRMTAALGIADYYRDRLGSRLSPIKASAVRQGPPAEARGPAPPQRQLGLFGEVLP